MPSRSVKGVYPGVPGEVVAERRLQTGTSLLGGHAPLLDPLAAVQEYGWERRSAL